MAFGELLGGYGLEDAGGLHGDVVEPEGALPLSAGALGAVGEPVRVLYEELVAQRSFSRSRASWMKLAWSMKMGRLIASMWSATV